MGFILTLVPLIVSGQRHLAIPQSYQSPGQVHFEVYRSFHFFHFLFFPNLLVADSIHLRILF